MMQNSETFEFVTLDVFTQSRFLGNPLAIVKIPRGQTLDQQLKQQIAREFNLSETVFLYDGESGSSERKIDIFTLS